jgi:hypothetical protein
MLKKERCSQSKDMKEGEGRVEERRGGGKR